VKERTSVFILWIKSYLKLVAALLLILSLIRIAWLFSYGNLELLNTEGLDLLAAFTLGLRFDLSDICYFSAPGFILTLIWILLGPNPPSRKIYQFYNHFWTAWIMLLLIICAVDFKYYSFFQDHINILIFGFFEDDTFALIKTFWQNYPVILIFITLITGYLLTYKSLIKIIWPYEGLFTNINPSFFKYRIFKWSSPLLPLFIFVSLVLGARGSFSLFPLEIMHTAISKNQFINVISFNGPHAFARATQLKLQQKGSWNEGLKNFGYQDQAKKAIADFLNKDPVEIASEEPLLALQKSTSNQSILQEKPPHVVFILMESMGIDWIKRHIEKNFNLLGALAKHFQKDFLFQNFMPASAATIGSLGTLLTNLPPQFMAPFLTDSDFIQVAFNMAPGRQFQKKNYETHFIYGGNLGWRNLAKFVPQQGFDHTHGEVEIQDSLKNTEKHDWGVYDEYVFLYVENILKQAKKPQFIFVLTTTNHPPYELPKNYQPLPIVVPNQVKKDWIGDPALNEQRLLAYQYGNHQLGLFLDRLKNASIGEKTILAATGDHSFYILPYSQDQILAKWGVPFYLYLPESYYPNGVSKQELKAQQNNYGSHIDIFPTLFHLSLNELSFLSLGKNLFAHSEDHWAIHSPSQSIFNDKGLVFVNSEQQFSAFQWDKNLKLVSSELTPDLKRAKTIYSTLFSITDLLFLKEKTTSKNK
jgi:phosphoglycerol transferase MdoB-like AlkP superfamily enzyme